MRLGRFFACRLRSGPLRQAQATPPSVFKVVAEHTEMIAEHSHSHGFEEDLYWALHGHSHDMVDHDHSQALLALGAGSQPSWGYRDNLRLRPSSYGPHRVYLIERPPRA